MLDLIRMQHGAIFSLLGWFAFLAVFLVLARTAFKGSQVRSMINKTIIAFAIFGVLLFAFNALHMASTVVIPKQEIDKSSVQEQADRYEQRVTKPK